MMHRWSKRTKDPNNPIQHSEVTRHCLCRCSIKKQRQHNDHVLVAKPASQPFPSSLYFIIGGASPARALKFPRSLLLFTSGTYGGVSVFFSIPSQSKAANHSCFLMFSMPPTFMGSRLLGVLWHKLLMKSSRGPLIFRGKRTALMPWATLR